MKDDLRRADENIADLRNDIDKEKAYSSRVKKKRDGARAKVEDFLAELDAVRRDLADARAALENAEGGYKRKVVELETSLANALRKQKTQRAYCHGQRAEEKGNHALAAIYRESS